MLKDLSRDDWLTWLNVPPHRVPKVLLLRGTRNLKRNYAKHSAHFKNVIEVGSPNSIFEDVLIGEYEGVSVGYASVYGDVMASEITHVFGAWGTGLVIQTGCCGGLGEHVLPGDLVCAVNAHCGEGAAQYYIPGVQSVEASPELVTSIPDYVDSIPVHKGPVFTTSALLAEGMKEVGEWCDQGFIAVDMETASTFAVAQHFGMRKISLLFAFDNPCRGEHILLSDSDKSERREKGEQAMIKMAFTLIRSL
jgi:purine-nucleoside phosphorylase